MKENDHLTRIVFKQIDNSKPIVVLSSWCIWWCLIFLLNFAINYENYIEYSRRNIIFTNITITIVASGCTRVRKYIVHLKE
jgi:hypothetical protein